MRSCFLRSLLGLLVFASACTGMVTDQPPATDKSVDQARDAVRKCDGLVPYAKGVRITEMAVYQTVKIRIFKDGEWIATRAADIVQGKEGILRVFVEPTGDFTPRRIKGVLTLTDGPRTYVDQRLVDVEGPSLDEKAETTFNFPLLATRVTSDARISVSLEEVDCGEGDYGSVEDARFPATNKDRRLLTKQFGKLRVVIVPVVIKGRRPLTNDAEIAKIRDALIAYYPVPEVEISVRRDLVYDKDVPSGNLSDLLQAIAKERTKDAPDNDVYYFGLAQPAATYNEHCGFASCVIGVSPVPIVPDAKAQYSVGLSFGDAQTYETIVHEIGHAHGRSHAPCADGGAVITAVDEQFPNPDGSTGTWGWDVRSRKLVVPGSKDIMGYCHPNWISAHNYRGLASRTLEVNNKSQQALVSTPPGGPLREIMLYEDGRTRWTGETNASPGGEAELATVLDASGHTVAEIEVVRIALSHGGGALLYVPAPAQGWDTLVLRDRRVSLAAILPPL